jgi:hypothetical protein
MEIVLLVTGTVSDEVPGPRRPGKRFVFSDDLVLERIDNRIPGNGLPQEPQDRRAGTHSGSVTVLRIAAADDKYLPGGGELFEYEGTYALTSCTPRKAVRDHWRDRRLRHRSWPEHADRQSQPPQARDRGVRTGIAARRRVLTYPLGRLALAMRRSGLRARARGCCDARCTKARAA